MEIFLQDVIRLLEEEKYKEAFLAGMKFYGQAGDREREQQIFSILEEVYYLPNHEKLEQNYQKNCTLLEQYPYHKGLETISYDRLPFQLFPVTDNEYVLYDKHRKQFGSLNVIATERETEYFFENLEEPLFLENEINQFNLRFLYDNVRRSEDYGGDNHVYLFYDSFSVLAPLLMVCGLEDLLEEKKFVFLIGEHNRSSYPVDFLEFFGIDYSRTAGPVQIEEVKRICFWYKHAHSGTVLSTGMLGSQSGIQSWCGHDFNRYSKINGKSMYDSHDFQSILGSPDTVFTVEQLASLAASEKIIIKLPDLDGYLEWLREKRQSPHEYSVREIFTGYFLFHYEKRGLNPRIAPMLLFDPHVWDPVVFNPVIASFPYKITLTCMREPVMSFTRCYMIGIAGWNKFQTQYLLASDYVHAQFLAPEFQKDYYGFRFEDFKQKPEQTARAVCRLLNIPYEPVMMEQEVPMTDCYGHTVRGFDHAPLHHNLDQMLSEFDKLRLKIFYEPIHNYYGYPSFDSREYPLDGQLVRKLFSYPFRFEKHLHKGVTSEELHQWIQEILQKAWRAEITCPKLIHPEEPEVPANE